MEKIVLITCWYGPFPWYLPYFVHSCSFNPDIDFIIITDNQEKIPNLPANIKMVSRTVDEIISAASEKLGFRINIDYPYKFCDFKPAYGYMFQELIKGYDFWGHCDLDIIYGDIRSFFTSEFLESYDYISVRHDYTTGCFGLYRNNPLLMNLFKESKDYKKVFSSADHYCFDECNFVWDALTRGESIFDISTPIESFTHVMKKAEHNGLVRTHFDFILMEGITGRLKFDNGTIVYKNKYEVIMYHLFWMKKVFQPTRKITKIPNRYNISASRIYH
ncbi:DUF6625 family protein [Chryseobacterium hagamense]|uniref:Glycosyl transferase n=1 Tax=Chryseobacterium hagamense TaxID=395935 RepID=A0A511YS64_9FLAO|nr:DUF6625 family protein [Chryseobacterium hagamense]GEN78028.1 hypothetical protein CHA01nite_37680 [Chryseobacterium hagamense]